MILLDARPLLAPSTRTEAHAGKFCVHSAATTIEYTGERAHLVGEMLSLLDGRSSVVEIAAQVGIGLEQAGALLSPLHDEALLLDTALELHEGSGGEFFNGFRRECRFWSQHIFAGRFWKHLRSGAAPLSMVLGWGIEFYHYVKYADEYMAAGVAHCSDSWLTRQWISKHFVEEAGHGEIFLEGLVDCGLSRSRIRDAPPLPATRALMNTLMESALEGALPYTACFGLTQPDAIAPTIAEHEQFYGSLRDHYPAAAGLFAAFLSHAKIDAGLKHDRTTIERILEARRGAEPSQRRTILRSVRRLAEAFVLFHDQIADFYAVPSCQVPRRALRMEEILFT